MNQNITSEMLCEAAFSESRRIVVYLPAIQKLGCMPAILLSELIDWRRHLIKEGRLKKDEPFFYVQKYLQEKFNCSEDKITSAFKKLKNKELITVERKGLPPRNYYTLNFEKIAEIIIENNENTPQLQENPGIDHRKIQDTIPGEPRNNRVPNNSTNYSGINTIQPPADKISSPSSPKGENSPYVDFWNTLGSTPKHRKIKKDGTPSKTYINAHSFCISLQKGTLGKKAGSIDEKFMRRNGILPTALSKKWTEEEIFEGLTRLNKLFMAEYSPYNKKTLPKNLPDMIYNPRTKTSMFLAVMQKAPMPIAEQCTPIKQDVYEMYLSLMKEFNYRAEDELTLKKQVNILIGKQRYIENYIAPYQDRGFISDFGEKNNYFYQTHIKWLVDCFGSKGITPSMLTTTWRAYVRWAYNFLHYDIDPTPETLNEWKLRERKRRRDAKQNEKFRVQAEQRKLEWLADQAM